MNTSQIDASHIHMHDLLLFIIFNDFLIVLVHLVASNKAF